MAEKVLKRVKAGTVTIRPGQSQTLASVACGQFKSVRFDLTSGARAVRIRISTGPTLKQLTEIEAIEVPAGPTGITLTRTLASPGKRVKIVGQDIENRGNNPLIAIVVTGIT